MESTLKILHSNFLSLTKDLAFRLCSGQWSVGNWNCNYSSGTRGSVWEALGFTFNCPRKLSPQHLTNGTRRLIKHGRVVPSTQLPEPRATSLTSVKCPLSPILSCCFSQAVLPYFSYCSAFLSSYHSETRYFFELFILSLSGQLFSPEIIRPEEPQRTETVVTMVPYHLHMQCWKLSIWSGIYRLKLRQVNLESSSVILVMSLPSEKQKYKY